MDTAKLKLIKPELDRDTELLLMQWSQDNGRATEACVWDALHGAVSLDELAEGHYDDDPYDALSRDGIDGYSGADSVMDGSHDHALMLVGFALLGDDDAVD